MNPPYLLLALSSSSGATATKLDAVFPGPICRGLYAEVRLRLPRVSTKFGTRYMRYSMDIDSYYITYFHGAIAKGGL